MREEDQCRQVGTAAAVQKRERAQQAPAGQSYPAQNYAPHDRGQPPPNQPMPQITSRRRGSGAEVVCWRCNMPDMLGLVAGCR